jgi:hypothetical protein
VGVGGLRGFDDLVAGLVRLAVGDVVVDRDREQERVVGRHADLLAQAVLSDVPYVVAVDRDRAVLHVVEALEEPRDGRLAAAGRADQRDGLARADAQRETVEDPGPEPDLGRVRDHVVALIHRRVGEADAVEPDVAANPPIHVRAEHGRIRFIGYIRLCVDDFVDATGTGRGALAHHQHHAELPERRLEHQHVGVERDDRADRSAAMDRHVTAEQQHEREADPGQVLDRRRPPGPDVGVLLVRPLDFLGGPAEVVKLALFGGEGLHDPHAVDVLVHDAGHVGEPGLDQPGHREQHLPHVRAHPVHKRHRHHGDDGERDVHRQHLDERDDHHRALHHDRRPEGQVHLHGTDVGVRPGDELAGLDPVIETERQRAQVLVDDVAQVVLHVVRRAQQEEPRAVGEGAADAREDGDPFGVAEQARAVRAVREVDGLAEQVGYLHLQDEAEETEQQRQPEYPLVGEHDR